MKKVFVLVFLATLLFVCSSCSLKEQDPNEEYFGKEKYSEIKQECSSEDKKEVQPVLDKIEQALGYIDENNDRDERFGVLSRYCISKESFPNVVKENGTIEFVTAKTDSTNGYIWIRYSKEGVDNSGNIVTGSWNILSRIEIEKIEGEWVAVSVDEAP